jgi:hypothetical protein
MVSLTSRFARLIQFDPTFRRPLIVLAALPKIRDRKRDQPVFRPDMV